MPGISPDSRELCMILFSMEAKVEFAALIIFAGIPSGPGAAPAESIFMQSDTKGWASVTSVRHVSIGHLFGLECCPHFQ